MPQQCTHDIRAVVVREWPNEFRICLRCTKQLDRYSRQRTELVRRLASVLSVRDMTKCSMCKRYYIDTQITAVVVNKIVVYICFNCAPKLQL